MDTAAFIAHIRNHYVDQFRAFVERQRKDCNRGAPEVKFRLGERSTLFEQLYCADFVKNEEGEVIELQPENILTFEPIIGSFGQSELSIENLRWDDVVFQHDLDHVDPEGFSRWFRLWFDPEDERHPDAMGLSGIVHCLLVEPKAISIDFGTADPEAFWDMLRLVEGAGAVRIKITSSRAEAAYYP